MEQQMSEVFLRVFKLEKPELPVPELTADAVLLETGMDSLGFASLIMELELELGFDPFSSSAEPYYPNTFGELVAYYEANSGNSG